LLVPEVSVINEPAATLLPAVAELLPPLATEIERTAVLPIARELAVTGNIEYVVVEPEKFQIVMLGLQAVVAITTSAAPKAAAVVALELVRLKNVEAPECPATAKGMPIGLAPVPPLPAGPVGPVTP
jgi:hypothetical protein